MNGTSQIRNLVNIPGCRSVQYMRLQKSIWRTLAINSGLINHEQPSDWILQLTFNAKLDDILIIGHVFRHANRAIKCDAEISAFN